MLKILTLIAAIAYTILIIVVSLVNIGEMPDLGTTYNDKILHFIAYLGLGFLWIFYLVPEKSKFKIGVVFLLLLLFGILLEAVQHIINPSRTYDNLDLISNCLGIIVGTGIVILYNSYKLNINKRLHN